MSDAEVVGCCKVCSRDIVEGEYFYPRRNGGKVCVECGRAEATAIGERMQ